MKDITTYIIEKKELPSKNNDNYCISLEEFCDKYNIKESKKQKWGTDFYNLYHYNVHNLRYGKIFDVFLSASKKDFLDYYNTKGRVLVEAQDYVKAQFNLSNKIFFIWPDIKKTDHTTRFELMYDDHLQYKFASFTVNYGSKQNVWKYHYAFMRDAYKDDNKIRLTVDELKNIEKAFITYLDYIISNK